MPETAHVITSIAPRSGGNAEFSVSDLSQAIKRALEDGFGFVRLRGEISGYRGPHASGHAYFALKDDKSKIEAVVWKGVFGRLKVRPEEGMEVIAQGRITTYPNSSKYQIVIEALEPAGVGALMALLEERKRKLAAEGLFAQERKRPIPFLSRVVGIVTSPTGAVIRDMLAGFAERCPTRVLIWPVRVQGEGSAAEVARAIRGFNALPAGGKIPRPDVIIVARGGGSLEDLWGFNEEIVVRAAAESAIPLVSAVGHETDWTLIDLVADARAPTPTKAAEWVVPKFAELIVQGEDLEARLRQALRRRLETHRTNLKSLSRGLPRLTSLVAARRQRFDAIEKDLGSALQRNTSLHDRRHRQASARLSPRLLSARLERARHAIHTLHRRHVHALGKIAVQRRRRLDQATGRLSPQTTRIRIAAMGERVKSLNLRLIRAVSQGVSVRRRLLQSREALLASLSYQSVLRRGYAVVRSSAGQAIRSASDIAAPALIEIELSHGRIAAQVLSTAEPARPQLSPASADERAEAKSPNPTGGSSGQGVLF